MSYSPNLDLLKTKGASFSIVIETENLGMAGIQDLRSTLASLENQTYSIHNAKELVIITSSHVLPETLHSLKNDYPWLTFHQEPSELEYTQSKMRGAEIVSSDIVVYVDSDVLYDTTWLANMLYGFVAVPDATVITGETHLQGKGLYSMAVQLVWMIHTVPHRSYPVVANRFQLNNFAIKRDVMLGLPFFGWMPVYRAHTVEWKKQLAYRGHMIIRVPGASGHHAPPGTFLDWWWRMLVHGADAVAKADAYFMPDGTSYEKFSPVRRLVRVPLFAGFKTYLIAKRAYWAIQEKPSDALRIICALPLVIVSWLVIMLGSCIALFNRSYLYRKITAYEAAHVV